MELGRVRGAMLWSIVNAIGSLAMRLADGSFQCRGTRIRRGFDQSVYQRRWFDLYMLAIVLGDMRGYLSDAERRKLVNDLPPGAQSGGECLNGKTPCLR
jgi:glucosamine--fructose-6-phosphate aminotransferase (isomerizing)